MGEARCPFCGRDPFHREDNGLGMVPVAVTCCELGREYWSDEGDEMVRQAGDEILGSRVTINRLWVLCAEMREALELTEQLDHRDDCPECEGEDEPERCGICCLVADEARLKRRAALSRARAKEDT